MRIDEKTLRTMPGSWKRPRKLFSSQLSPLLCLPGGQTPHFDSHFPMVAGLNVGFFFSQLLSCLEKSGLDTEGILRVPGSQARVKVKVWLPRRTEVASPSIPRVR